MAASDQEWWRGAVIYQIYPRSFQDSDGDGIGDLKGMISRLDYVKSLGVDGIWLSPFFKSPMRDFGYDVCDYRAVDPMFGTLEDFDHLLVEAHKRDLKIIIDQVWSHSSSDHPWFEASRQDRQNDKSGWYVWADPKPDGSPPNNWQAWFGGPAWTWEPRRRQYYLHNFLPTQPDLNLRNPEVRNAVKDIARFWLDKGVDGFRLDVVNYFIHDARLRDNPPSGHPSPALPRDMQLHSFNSNQSETLEFVEELRALTDTYESRMMVGEIAPGSFKLMQEYTQGHNRLHTAYSFDLLGDWPGVERLAELISQWGEGPGAGWPSWAMSNHDVARVATRWGQAIGASPAEAAPLFLAFLMCLRGTVFIYQGEERGLEQSDVPFEKLQDPWGIAGWPGNKGRDGCRTPMPWEVDAPNAGFTNGEPWLPVDLRHVADADNVQDILSLTKQLTEFRRGSHALMNGTLALRGDSLMRPVLELARVHGREAVLAAFNFSAASVVCQRYLGELVVCTGDIADNGDLSLPPYGFAIFKAVAEQEIS